MNTWDEIKKLKGRTLTTLDHRKPFDIVDVTEHALIVRPHETNIERRVQRNEIEDAYKRLVAIGELTRSEIMKEFSSFNPAYVAAILAELPNIKYSRKPIRLSVIRNS